MGSCISKCKPKTKIKPQQDCSSHVQDKLVISQAPLSPIPPTTPRKLPLCPSPSPSTTYSSSSFSSFSCASKTNSSELTSSSLSSSSSCSSSILCSKDRSFSNEFLWSCVKENPQIIGLDPIKDRVHPQKLEIRTKPNVAPVKQSIPESLVRSTTQKRQRANSPTLTRQKSFRVEPKMTNSTYSKNLRSPSPSRRFNGNNCDHKDAFSTYTAKESSSSSSNSNKHSVNSARKENVTPAGRLSRDRSYLRNRETCTYQIGSKADEVGIKEVRSDMLMDIPMEDIDNPLIALDCFIFL